MASAISGATDTTSGSSAERAPGRMLSVTKSRRTPASAIFSSAPGTKTACVAETVTSGCAPAWRSARTLSTMVEPVAIMSSTMTHGRPLTSPVMRLTLTSVALVRCLWQTAVGSSSPSA